MRKLTQNVIVFLNNSCLRLEETNLTTSPWRWTVSNIILNIWNLRLVWFRRYFIEKWTEDNQNPSFWHRLIWVVNWIRFFWQHIWNQSPISIADTISVAPAELIYFRMSFFLDYFPFNWWSRIDRLEAVWKCSKIIHFRGRNDERTDAIWHHILGMGRTQRN